MDPKQDNTHPIDGEDLIARNRKIVPNTTRWDWNVKTVIWSIFFGTEKGWYEQRIGLFPLGRILAKEACTSLIYDVHKFHVNSAVDINLLLVAKEE